MGLSRFLGCQYPLVKSPRGLLGQKVGTAQIKADLLQLLLTNPGERVMMPTYGTPLRTLIFEPNDATLVARARQMIADSITKWEPRIVVTAINVSSTIDPSVLSQFDTMTEIGAILSVQINFVDPNNIQQVEQLVLQVPLGG